LLFNTKLSARWRLFLIVIMGAIAIYSFGEEQERLSNWVSVAVAMGILIWLRFPRVRLIAVTIICILVVTGVLFQFIYEYAGGDAKWFESGGSRLALIGRVVELSMRNPVTGLGPAAYRPYGFTTSLFYEGQFYSSIALSSHNNYVDLFSHTGLIGLGLFLWFMCKLIVLGIHLRKYYANGFAGAYLNSMIAAWFGVMVVMAFADWFLPFVYNIGFLGFQASILVWMFLGGVVALEQMARNQTVSQE
jgi:O-antigen ligase